MLFLVVWLPTSRLERPNLYAKANRDKGNHHTWVVRKARRKKGSEVYGGNFDRSPQTISEDTNIRSILQHAKDELYDGDQKYLIGDHRITPHDIILIGAVQVSQGSWMPILQLNDVQWYARFMWQWIRTEWSEARFVAITVKNAFQQSTQLLSVRLQYYTMLFWYIYVNTVVPYCHFSLVISVAWWKTRQCVFLVWMAILKLQRVPHL